MQNLLVYYFSLNSQVQFLKKIKNVTSNDLVFKKKYFYIPTTLFSSLLDSTFCC